jgi:putative mRNA 3-end processing factor
MTTVGAWIDVRPEGIYIPAADLWIDPSRPKDRVAITHGHADHARAGHGKVLATADTLAIMHSRYGPQPGGQALGYGETVRLDDITVSFHPAGHVLGSAQIALDFRGERVVISGDYKRRQDPTCTRFEPVPCDVFITEATFALPVFRHPDDGAEIAKALAALASEPQRCLLIGAYSLGKAQRVIALLRQAGYQAPIYLHGAMKALCALYQARGVDLGTLLPVAGDMAGQIVMAPPSALRDRWSAKLPDPITAMASGWMRVRQRAKQNGVELPLIISDHADWDELTQTLSELRPQDVWITHGRDDALVHWCALNGLRARALALTGREDEGD